MPKILNYTPRWLSRPSPGFDLFAASSDATNAKPNKASASKGKSEYFQKTGQTCAQRKLARRGTEVFVAVGSQLRWADSQQLKYDWEEREAKHDRKKRGGSLDRGYPEGTENIRTYKVLKTPCTQDIQQLIISPNGVFLAIVTSHTIEIAVLPDSSRLLEPGSGPIRVKTYALGPATHVREKSPVASALWHPLGVAGLCLVTITVEAVVRVWEFNVDNQWSFQTPALTIDLFDLANGKSTEVDFGASIGQRSRGFSADAVEMEVASACFGGIGSDEENGWGPMTLWVAMSEGDVYALCPLLPSRWQAPSTLIPSLSVSIVGKAAALQDDLDTSEEDKRNHARQLKWIAAIDSQDSTYLPSGSEFVPDFEIHARPQVPRTVPQLQGPFDFDLDLSEGEPGEGLPAEQLTDIYVVAGRPDDEGLSSEDDLSDFESSGSQGLSLGVICLLTNHGLLHICLDPEGVEGKWLSKTSKRTSETHTLPTLLKLESIKTIEDKGSYNRDSIWPVFVEDPYSRYSFFVNHGTGNMFLSLIPWTERLESEIQCSTEAGTEFRLGFFKDGAGTMKERIFYTEEAVSQNEGAVSGKKTSTLLTGSVVFRDPYLGYFLLAAALDRPYSASFDLPMTDIDESLPWQPKVEPDALAVITLREPYQPSPTFFRKSVLPPMLSAHVSGRPKPFLKEEIRLSSATLDVMVKAHQIVSDETGDLNAAASELFRRCDRLQSEFQEQIRFVKELADKIDNIAGENDPEPEPDSQGHYAYSDNDKINKRLYEARDRQEQLVKRYDTLLSRVALMSGRELSDREKSWISEIKRLQACVFEGSKTDEDSRQKAQPLRKRYLEAKELAVELVAEAKEAASEDLEYVDETGIKVPSQIRKAKVAQVMTLLERESALVDATKARLERLSIT